MAVIDYVLAVKVMNSAIKQAVNKHKKQIHIGEISFHDFGNNKHGVIVECSEPGYINDIIVDVVRNSKYGSVNEVTAHAGFFDWHADTYIKDAADVNYTVK